MCIAGPQMMLISTGVSTFASLRAGSAQARAYKESAKAEVEQIQADKEVAKLESKIAVNSRWRDYADAMATNNTFLALSGRDLGDASALALFEKNYNTVQEDIKNLDLQLKLDQNKRDRLIDTTLDTAERKASIARSSALIGAFDSVSSGIMQYEDIKIRKGTP